MTVIRFRLRYSSSPPSGPVVELHCPVEIRCDHVSYFEQGNVIGGDVSFLVEALKGRVPFAVFSFLLPQ